MEISANIEKFSFVKFMVINVCITATFTGIGALIFPSTFRPQLNQSLLTMFGLFILVHFVNAFVEYFVHRYVLHAKLPYFQYFYQRHTTHHSHTSVRSDGVNIYDTYPIVHEEQHEASFMSWYTLGIFSLLYTPFFIVCAFAVPSVPMFIPGYLALLWSMVLYESLHYAFHIPLTAWKTAMAIPLIGTYIKGLYEFHYAHHACAQNNISVSGFFTFPIADLLFGTYTASLISNPRSVATPTRASRVIRFLDSVFRRHA
jgi:hemolysin III